MAKSLAQLKSDAKRAGWAKQIRTAADEASLLAGCRFDKARAAHAVGFFAQYLRHSKGQWAGQPFELLKWHSISSTR